jgi:hypothetical protein
MTSHDIQARIDAMKQERDAFQREAEKRLSFIQGGIAALEMLLQPAEPERVVNQSFEGVEHESA